MNKITEVEKRELAKTIENAGLYRYESLEEFVSYLENCMDGYRKNQLFSYMCGGTFNAQIVKELLCSVYSTIGTNSITYADSKDLNACAVWIPSGVSSTNLTDFFKNGGLKMLQLGGIKLLYRVASYESTINGMKKNITNHNDWYLYNYECKPEYDNDETFIKMVEPVVSYAWSTGRACYIECSVESRMAPLMKMGFHIIDSVTIPKTNIKLYGMMV